MILMVVATLLLVWCALAFAVGALLGHAAKGPATWPGEVRPVELAHITRHAA